MDVRFTTDFTESMVDQITSMMGQPTLRSHTDYPSHLSWIDKAQRELRSGNKRAVIALTKPGRCVASLVFQQHKQLPGVLELKNLTVDHELLGLSAANFMVLAAEREGIHAYGSRVVVCDTKATNRPIRLLALSLDYKIVGQYDLYKQGGGEDILLAKELKPRRLRPISR